MNEIDVIGGAWREQIHSPATIIPHTLCPRSIQPICKLNFRISLFLLFLFLRKTSLVFDRTSFVCVTDQTFSYKIVSLVFKKINKKKHNVLWFSES